MSIVSTKMNQLAYRTGWEASPPMPQIAEYTLSTQLYGFEMRSFEHAVLDRRTDVAVNIINYYAKLLRAENGNAESEFPYSKIIDILVPKSDHCVDFMLRIILRLGELLENKGRLPEAENFYVWSLARFGEHDPRRFYIFYWIGVVHSHQVRLEADPGAKECHISTAKHMFHMALCGFTSLWGHNNMWERTVAVALGKLYENENVPHDTVSLLNEDPPRLSDDSEGQYWAWIKVYLRLMEHNKLEMAQNICDTIFIFLAKTLGHSHELTIFVAEHSADLTCRTKKLGKAKEINQHSKTFNQLMLDKAPALIKVYKQPTGRNTQAVQNLYDTIWVAFVKTFEHDHELTHVVARDLASLLLQTKKTGTTQKLIMI